MQSGSKKEFQAPGDLEMRSPARHNKLERTSWMNWFLLTGGGFLTIVWLAGTAIILLAGQGFSIDKLWPPSAPYLALVLAVIYLLFGAHLTFHQHRVVNKRQERTYDRLLAILSVTRTLGAESDPQTVFDCITSTCRTTYDCDQVSLTVLDRPSKQLEVRSVSGHLNPQEVLGTKMDMGQGVVGWVAERREPMVLGTKVNRSEFKDFQSKAYTISSAMIIPIILHEQVYGVLSVTSRTKKVDYDLEDVQSLQVFAEYAGICVRHAEKSNKDQEAA